MPSYLVETYLARGDTRERLDRERRARSAAAELTRERTRVRFDRAIHVPEDEMCFYVFDAPSVREAALAAERAGLDPLRVVEAVSSRGGGDMRSRWALCALLVLGGLTVYAANVLATPSVGFTGSTLAKATYGEIFSHVHTVPATWDEHIQTKGDSDLYVQQNTWQPGGSTGWHTHPGPSFIIVTQGSVTVYDGDDPACTPHVFTANTAENGFVDPGDGHDHVIRNETSAVAQTIAVQLIPEGAARRQDVPDPGNCHF